MEKSKSQVAMNFLSTSLFDNFKTLTGKVLTIADAVLEDDIQRKATKNLLEQTIRGIKYIIEEDIRTLCSDLAICFKEEIPFNPVNDQSTVTRKSMFEN